MELYILDSLLRRTEVIDKFESLIWTERYSQTGDFVLDIKSSTASRGLLQAGTKLAVNESYRGMTVLTTEDSVNAEGKDILKVTGFSFEDVLSDRVYKNTMSDTTIEPNTTIVDTPGNIARTIFDHVARTGSLDANDIIPFLQPGSIFAPGTNPETSSIISITQAPEILYTILKNICDMYDLGFRLIRNFDTSQLYFDIYTGDDRTTRQILKPAVIFSPGLENIQNTSELTNIQNSKNVAYVFSPAGFKVVFGENVPDDIDGFDRRIMVVNANVASGDPDADSLMDQAGTEALAQNRATQMFDGEVDQYSKYKYGIDYNLGDIVEMRNKDGIITYKRVTEHIFVSDEKGDRSYPTLTADLFTGVDTWVSWNNKSTAWYDYDIDTITTWATL